MSYAWIRNARIKENQPVIGFRETVTQIKPNFHTLVATIKTENVQAANLRIGQLEVTCLAEVELNNNPSARVIIPLIWWDKQEKQIFIAGLGFARPYNEKDTLPKPGPDYCLSIVRKNLLQNEPELSATLYSGQDDDAKGQRQLMAKANLEVAVPQEFWETGKVSILPKIANLPFLLISDLSAAPVWIE